MFAVCPLSARGEATVRYGWDAGGGLLRAVPLDKPFLLSTLRVVATIVVYNKESGEQSEQQGGQANAAKGRILWEGAMPAPIWY